MTPEQFVRLFQSRAGLVPDGIPGRDTLRALGEAYPPKAHALSDPSAFFSAVRKITGPLDQVQVDTINRILAGAAHWPVGWLAYGLATAWHEARMKPIEEWGRGKGRPYSQPGKYGQSQHGRGLVQLTWDRNYEWADKIAAEAGLINAGDILKDFDLVLRPDIAALALVKGMEEGAFTDRGLADYIHSEGGTLTEFINARRVINGTDKAALIAGYAEQFRDALVSGGWS